MDKTIIGNLIGILKENEPKDDGHGNYGEYDAISQGYDKAVDIVEDYFKGISRKERFKNDFKEKLEELNKDNIGTYVSCDSLTLSQVLNILIYYDIR